MRDKNIVHGVVEIEDSNGDFNDDGRIDAADYVVWRKNGGTPQAYNTWRAHLANRPASD